MKRFYSPSRHRRSKDDKLPALHLLDSESESNSDGSVTPIPFYREGLRFLRKDVIDGDIHREQDLEALLITLLALLPDYRIRDYCIFREPYANPLSIDAKELDESVSNIMHTSLESVANALSNLAKSEGAK